MSFFYYQYDHHPRLSFIMTVAVMLLSIVIIVLASIASNES